MDNQPGLLEMVTLLPQGALVHDLEGTLLAANDTALKLLDGSVFLDPSAERARQLPLPPPWLRVTDQPVLAELPVDTDEGVRWLTAESMLSETGDRKVVVTMLMDHSERLRMIQTLLDDAVIRFGATWRGSAMPVFLVGVDGEARGRLLTSNQALGDLMGAHTDELLGRSVSELFLHSVVDGGASRLLDDVVEQLLDGRTERHRGPAITRGTAKAGRPVELHLVVTRGPSGRVAFLVGHLTDERELASTIRRYHLEQRRLELIFAHGSDLLVVINPEGRFEFIGPSGLNVLGYDRRNVIGTEVFDLVHPDDRQLAADALTAAAQTPGRTAPLRLRVRDGFDEWRPVEVVANNLLDDPVIGGIVVTIRDRSWEALTEARLAAHEERYREIVELSLDGIAMVDRDRRITFANRRFGEILRCESADLIGKSVVDLAPPAHRDQALEAIELWRTAPRERVAVTMGRADGSLVRALVSASPHLVDGEIVGAVAWVTDITESERTRAELQRSEEEVRALVEAIPDLIFRLDRNGTYLEYSCSEPELLLVDPEDFLGRTIGDVLPAGVAAGTARRCLDAIDGALSSGQLTTVEYSLAHSGSTRWYEARFSVAGDDEVLAVVRDITDLKLSEAQRIEHERALVRRDEKLRRAEIENELERASRIESMGYFAASMAHDVNNLLGVINNYAATIEHSDAADSVRSSASEIRWAVRSGADLTDRLLSFGRQHARARADVDMTALLNDVGERLRAVFDPIEGAKLVVGPFDADCWALVDQPRIEQAVVNLVLNARDATVGHLGSGEVGLSLELRNVDADADTGLAAGCYAVVAVTDQGPGIPSDAIPRIWEPFYSTKGTEGTGLGLPIVRRIAQEHQGAVVVREGNRGAGTRMELWLPAPCDTPTPSSTPPRTESPTVELVLVDDNELVLRSTAGLLSQMGHVVRPFATASEVVDLLAEGTPAAVLTDVRMPDLSGIELARWIRTHRPDTPVAFVTGYAADLCAEPDLHDLEVLEKPYAPEALDALARRLLRSAAEGCSAPR